MLIAAIRLFGVAVGWSLIIVAVSMMHIVYLTTTVRRGVQLGQVGGELGKLNAWVGERNAQLGELSA